jgi:tetratricopeptide (TPR) repeat protein
MRVAMVLAWLVLSLAWGATLPQASSAQTKKGSAPASASAPVPAAGASDEVARGLFQAGKAAYEAGNYSDALSFFQQAHARSGRPELLFNIGQAADRLRRDEQAIEALRAYLTQLPDAPNRVEVQARIRALEHALQERSSAAATSSDPGATAAPAPVPTPRETAAQAAADDAQPPTGLEGSDASASKPVTKQWWFWTGIGAVVVGGTAVALAVALGGDDAGREPFYEGNGGSLQGP